LENLKEGEKFGVDDTVILNLILEKYIMNVWKGLKWLDLAFINTAMYLWTS
jgi:hypothetical protein